MHKTNLRGTDLNLLVILRVLLEECNTTRAAERLAMSQPAVSRALARLRLLYDDPLLVRTPQGMEPTSKARALQMPLSEILQAVAQTLQPATQVKPADFTGTLRIAAHTYVEYVILPGLIERLHQTAPHLTIQIVPLGNNGERLLDEGEVEMVIAKQTPLPNRFVATTLFEDQLICAASAQHPLAGQSIDDQTFAQADHLLVAPDGSLNGNMDTLLASEAEQRHNQLVVQSFLAAPFILARSRLLLTAPARILAPLMAPLGLTRIETAFPLPAFSVIQIRHRRDDNHARLNWFADTLQGWCRELQDR